MSQPIPDVVRLHLGCGPVVVPGWLNVDRHRAAGVDLCADLVAGLPLRDGGASCAVAMHVLQDLAWPDIPIVLRDWHRVLRPGGVLRLGLPDLDRALDAYRRGDGGYFHVPDSDARSIGAKLVTQIIWYGSVRTPFTFDYANEVLGDAGFRDIRRCEFGCTQSGLPELASLDNRARESLFVEATA